MEIKNTDRLSQVPAASIEPNGSIHRRLLAANERAPDMQNEPADLRYNPASNPTMRKAALLYNPDSGGSQQRQRELESALAVLRGAGVEADLVAPRSPQSR